MHLKLNWTEEHQTFVNYHYDLGFDPDVIIDRFLYRFPNVILVIGVDPCSLTPQLKGKRIAAIGGRIRRLKRAGHSKNTTRTVAMAFGWGRDLAREVDVPSAEVDQRELQSAMGLLWDWYPKEERVPPRNIA